MSKSALLAVGRKSDLYRHHQALYRLIVDKIEKNDTLTLAEARSIWLTIPTSRVHNGVPHRIEYQRQSDSGFYAPVAVPLNDDEVIERTLRWLTSSIGLLVVRGYLKVTPMLDVRQLPDAPDVRSAASHRAKTAANVRKPKATPTRDKDKETK